MLWLATAGCKVYRVRSSDCFSQTCSTTSSQVRVMGGGGGGWGSRLMLWGFRVSVQRLLQGPKPLQPPLPLQAHTLGKRPLLGVVFRRLRSRI